MTGRPKPPRFPSHAPAEVRMPTRRDFALTIGAATLGACARTPSLPPATPAPTSTAAPVTTETDANAPLADALTQLVRQRYGAHQIGRASCRDRPESVL